MEMCVCVCVVLSSSLDQALICQFMPIRYKLWMGAKLFI